MNTGVGRKLHLFRFPFVCFIVLLSLAKSPLVDAADELYAMSLNDLLAVEITSASRRAETQQKAPAKIVLINRQQIEQRGYENLFDLLRDLPGFDTQAYSHETTYNHVGTRGVVGNNRYLIQRDGIYIDSPATDPIALADNFPLFDIERVEIVYGPASSLYGADAFNGVINLVSRSLDGVEVGIGWGEFSQRAVFIQSKTALTDAIGLSFSAHLKEADNPDLSKYYPDVMALGDLIRFDGSVAVPASQRAGYYGRTKSHSLNLGANVGQHWRFFWRQSEFQSPTSTGLRPNTIDFATAAFWRTGLNTYAASYEHDVSDELRTQFRAQHQSYKVHHESKFNNLFTGFTDGFKFAEAKVNSAEGMLAWQLSDNQHLTVGAIAEFFDAIPKTADLPRPYDEGLPPFEQPLFYVGTEESLPIRIFSLNYENTGLFGQYRHKLSSHFDLVVGARYDDNSRYGDTTTFRTGAVYQPSNQLTLKMLYGEAFLAPAPEFAFEHFGSFSGQQNEQGLYESGFMFIPNSELKPETSQTLELSASYHPSNALTLDASIYKVEVEDFILNTTTPEPVNDFIPGGDISVTAQNGNVGKIDSLGFDLSVLYIEQGPWGQLEAWLNYSYLDSDFSDRTRAMELQAPFTAEHKIKAGITQNIGSAYISLIYHWIDDTAADTPQIDPVTTPGFRSRHYHVFNLNLGVRDLLPGLNLSMHVENLLDERYFNAGTGVNITFVESPQNPRLARVNLSYQF